MVAHIAGYKEVRQWGSFEVLAVGQGYEVKRLAINPGVRLSDQRHQHRTESWIVVSGEGSVHLEYPGHQWMTTQLVTGNTIDIHPLVWHRLDNRNSSEPLVIIEVWIGSCDETDIERRADDFGRV